MASGRRNVNMDWLISLLHSKGGGLCPPDPPCLGMWGAWGRGLGGEIDEGFGGEIDEGFGGEIDEGFGGEIDEGFGGEIDEGLAEVLGWAAWYELVIYSFSISPP